MKGDFSRASIDQQRGYSGVLMQQGRVQLDSDWNEQVAITRHAIEARTRDLLGPLGAPEGVAGFAISARAAAPPAPAGSCELAIGAGRLYVDGLLCENSAPALAVLPFALPDEATDGRGLALAYLDVWERHVTALEDERLREPGLGGPDTTTRTQTAWRVALLPVASPSDRHDARTADWRTVWERFVAARARRARLEVTVAPKQQANQLYRVEIHDISQGRPRFKWSRENGSVAFPVTGIRELQPDDPARPTTRARLLTGEERAPGRDAAPEERGGTVAVVTARAPVLIELMVLQLERDPQAIVAGDTVEIEDALSGLGDAPTLVGVVADVHILPGQGELLGELVAHVTVRADATQVAALAQRVAGLRGTALRQALHPLVRRWDRSSDTARPDPRAELSLIVIEAETRYSLDPGISLRFDNLDDLRPGDYWQFTVRAEQEQQRWAPRPPDGPAHRFAPLALLEADASGLQVAGDLRAHFQSAPALSAALAREQQRINDTSATVERLQDTVEQLQAALALATAELTALRVRVAEVRGRLESEYIADEAIEEGAVVAAHPGSAERIELAGDTNAGLVIGVVALVDDRPDVGSPIYRVVTYGRASCWVKGAVQPGDLLVVSEAPGVARRAGFYVRPGTLLGKALTGAPADDEGGSMRVDVMVTLG